MERKSTKRPICGGEAVRPDSGYGHWADLKRGGIGRIAGGFTQPLGRFIGCSLSRVGKKPFPVASLLLWFPPGLQLRTDTPNPKRERKRPTNSPLSHPISTSGDLHVGRRSEFRWWRESSGKVGLLLPSPLSFPPLFCRNKALLKEERRRQLRPLFNVFFVLWSLLPRHPSSLFFPLSRVSPP